MAEISIYTLLTENITEEHLAEAMKKLPEWRGEYIAKKNFQNKADGAFSYLLLQKLSMERFGITDTARFTYGEYGKPYFSQSKAFFSISHCKTAVAAAVSENEVGIDIMDNRKVSENVPLRICSDRELEKYRAAEDKQAFLIELWCKKESLVKKSGVGFSKGFKAAETEGADFYIYKADKYTVSAALDPHDTVSLKEISFTELL